MRMSVSCVQPPPRFGDVTPLDIFPLKSNKTEVCLLQPLYKDISALILSQMTWKLYKKWPMLPFKIFMKKRNSTKIQ